MNEETKEQLTDYESFYKRQFPLGFERLNLIRELYAYILDMGEIPSDIELKFISSSLSKLAADIIKLIELKNKGKEAQNEKLRKDFFIKAIGL